MAISPSIVCSAIIPVETVIDLLKPNSFVESGFILLTDQAMNVLLTDNMPDSEPVLTDPSGPVRLDGLDFEVIVMDNEKLNLRVVFGIPEYVFQEASRRSHA